MAARRLLLLLALRPSAALRSLPAAGSLAANNPPVEEFARIWRHRYGQEERLHEPMASSIRLVLGVMSVPQDGAYRQVIRETWLRQRGVCYWSAAPREGCSVYVAFVMGNNGTGKFKVPMSWDEEEAARKEPGMFVLPVEENMDGGKSMHWFREALKAFPWATHYGKADVDTYPFLHKLVHRMAGNRSCVAAATDWEYIGRPWYFCSKHKETCGNFTRTCSDPKQCFGRVRGYEHMPLTRPFRFLLGEFYALSAPLAAAVDWQPRVGKEDEEVGEMVNATAVLHRKCVAIRRLDATLHMAKTNTVAWANKY